MKKDKFLNYPRELICYVFILITLTSAVRETIRHFQIDHNYKRVIEITVKYDGPEETQLLNLEKQKMLKSNDGLNAMISSVELIFLILMLYKYDKKYFDDK